MSNLGKGGVRPTHSFQIPVDDVKIVHMIQSPSYPDQLYSSEFRIN